MRNKVLIITGLTASGKSGLAIEVAKKYNGEIISCDSVQVYRGLDIGSAKETKENREEVRHHLIDVVDPNVNFNVGDFLSMASEAIIDCLKRGKLPIICGGTGMYVKALMEGYTLGEKSNDEFRKHWEEFAKIKGKTAVWEELNKLNCDLAKNVHQNNLHRVIRYLEMATFGMPEKEPSILENFDVLCVGINQDKDKIYSKINKRVDEMIAMGLENEVKGLIKKGLSLNNSSMNTIGYREMYMYLTGDIDYEKCIELIKQHTRNYAKRQLTFMKTIKNIQILNLDEARAKIEEFLN